RIGADSFDLLLLHNPDRTGYSSEAVWAGMRALRDDGLTELIGIAPGPANGFTLDLIDCVERFGEMIDWAMVILNPLEPLPGEASRAGRAARPESAERRGRRGDQGDRRQHELHGAEGRVTRARRRRAAGPLAAGRPPRRSGHPLGHPPRRAAGADALAVAAEV